MNIIVIKLELEQPCDTETGLLIYKIKDFIVPEFNASH